MNKVVLIMVVMTLVGCDVKYTPDYQQSSNAKDIDITTTSSNRFKVERVQVFRDGIAYNSTRGIYLLTDTETGQEFVGVSGVGISELGMHNVAKSSATDER